MMRRATIAVGLMVLATTAGAQGAKPLKKCPPDAVISGTVCMDKFEASVWRVPTGNKGLAKKIEQGKATAEDLVSAGATPLGVESDNYDPCTDSGQQNCLGNIYAVSLPGVTPSRFISWFQAQQACKNVRKRLPSNAEWQAAVAGTPDPGPDDGAIDCNSGETLEASLTGSRSDCVSDDGAFDMVGNLAEWVGDWVPLSDACHEWSAEVSPTLDDQCLASVAVEGAPGALVRGGHYERGPNAGPLAVEGLFPVSYDESPRIGFRCAR